MARKTTEEDEDLLNDLGVDTESQDQGSHSAREQRIIAGFEEIERFVKENGRLPSHGEDKDIFERLYATRLDQIRRSEECREVLQGRDPQGLLGEAPEVSSRVMELPSDEELLAELAQEGSEEDITKLTHVRPWQEIKAAEEVASRNPCADFAEFRPIFQKVQEELDSRVRTTIPFADNADVNQGDLFILHGQKLYVAECGDQFVSDYGRPDRRLRVIYDNGTESDLLVRSLQRGLNKDKASRRITAPDMGPLFSGESSEEDLPSGFVYIVRSKSDHPYIAENRTVIHKIGVTGASDVKKRLANAKKDPTFLLADVELVGEVKLSNINRVKLEALLHRFFAEARLDLVLKDRFGEEIVPREWFIVPLAIIEEALEKLIDGSISKCRYDAKSASIVKI
jgi:Meiotically up-regulated gene 113